MELRFCCAFASFLYRIGNSDTLLLRPWRFYCALAVYVKIHVILTKISNRSESAVQWNGGGGGVIIVEVHGHYCSVKIETENDVMEVVKITSCNI